jgi:cell wall-associated NlpC family hydrolase
MLGQGDLRGLSIGELYAELAVRKAQDVLDANKAAQQDYQVGLDQLRAEQTRAHAAAASLQAARRAAEGAVAQQESRLGKLQGDLAALVAAEQARQQAAREARTRATVRQDVVPPQPAIAPRRTPRRGGPTDPGTTKPPPVNGSRASTAVAEARRQLGKPYHWGGSGGDSYDCSGLTMWAWRAAGVGLPHYSGAQYSATTHIPLSALQPGDLVFFYSDLSHVGIYVGGGQMIAAPQPGESVKQQAVGNPTIIRRILPDTSATTPFSTGTSSALAGVPYANLFTSAGAKYGVDPSLLAAVANQESSFNSQAVSPAGAEGLMQFMPSTAAGLGINPLDPTSAVDGAARYLSSLQKQFGSTSLALAAYNAGPGAVSRYGGIPPYAETQNYVAAVTQKAQAYA